MEFQRRAAADPRYGGLSPAIAQPARPDRRRPDQCLRTAAAAAAPRRLCRGRGRAGDPRGGEPSCIRVSARRCSAAASGGSATRRRRSASSSAGGIEIINAALSSRNAAYAAYLYERLQRRGFLQRDCQRLVNQDRNHFAACMVALGDADAMVTGVTRNFSVALEDVRRCIDRQARPPRDGRLAGAGARPHGAGRRHRGDRTAHGQRNRRDHDRGGARRADTRLRSAGRAARLLDTSAIR